MRKGAQSKRARGGYGRARIGVPMGDGMEVVQITSTAQFRCSCKGNEHFDAGTPVSDDYQVSFHLTGRLDKLMLAIGRPKLSHERVKKPMAAGAQ